MQRTSNDHRSASSSTASVAKRLSAYAATATGAMLASSSADAAVVIVDITDKDASTNFTIDLSAARFGMSNFTFTNSGFTAGAYGRINNGGQFVATNLVGNSVDLGPTSSPMWTTSAFFSFPNPGSTGYLGFRLTDGGANSRYGWIEYVNDGTSTWLTRWAYESQVNTVITTPSASAVPGGAGLAALALGAAGIRGRRRRTSLDRG